MELQELGLVSLDKAIASLNEAVVEYASQPANKFIRDAAILRFKYTYELTHKIIKHYLEITEPSVEEVDQMTFPDLIRTASTRGLLTNGWNVWKDYRHARNADGEQKATEIYMIIPLFLVESQNLLVAMKKCIAQDAV
jgi:nucleotidyltransferase substrate binding protein (TIGR01987 family)